MRIALGIAAIVPSKVEPDLIRVKGKAAWGTWPTGGRALAYASINRDLVDLQAELALEQRQ